MEIEEFRERTKTFLGLVSNDEYNACYEPAYMALDYVDKDEFCKVLQDKVVRKIVTGFSEYVIKSREALRNSEQRYKDFSGTNDYLIRQLRLLQAICDRSLKPGAHLEVLK